MGNYVSVLGNVSVPILIACLSGYLIAKRRPIHTVSLTDVGLFVLAPGLIILSLAQSPAHGEPLLLIGAFIAIHTTLCALSGWFTAKVMGWSPASRAGTILTTSFGNAVNYGLPLLLLAFGSRGFSLGAAYVLYQVVLVNTVGMYIASRSEVQPKEAIRNVLRAPLIYAAAIGLILYITQWHLPTGVESGVKLLGDAYPAIVLMILGIQMGNIRFSGIKRTSVWLSVVLRIVIVPILAKLTLLILGIHGLLASVLFVQSSMPAAINASVLTEKYNGDKEQVALTVGVTTLLSFLYLPLFIAIGAS